MWEEGGVYERKGPSREGGAERGLRRAATQPAGLADLGGGKERNDGLWSRGVGGRDLQREERIPGEEDDMACLDLGRSPGSLTKGGRSVVLRWENYTY